MEAKFSKDINRISNFINSHPKKKDFISIFTKGPPADKGFMWGSIGDGNDSYWSYEEATALKDLTNLVLDLGWDSSGYGIMMRNIQSIYLEGGNTPEVDLNDTVKEDMTFEVVY